MELYTPSYGLLIWMIASFLVVILSFISLVSILKSDFDFNIKLIWTIIVFAIPIIGSLIYFGLKRRSN